MLIFMILLALRLIIMVLHVSLKDGNIADVLDIGRSIIDDTI
jgi:hypothetical protein